MRVGIAAGGHHPGRRGGVDTYVLSLTGALAAHGAGLEVVLLLGEEDVVPPEPGREVQVARLRAPRRAAAAADRARRALRAAGWAVGRDTAAAQIDALGLDVVHYPATELRETGLRTPAVLTFFDMQEEVWPRHFSRRDRLARRAAHRAAVRAAAQVVAPSRFTLECLRDRYGVPEGRLWQVPVGIGEDATAAAPAGEPSTVRAAHGIPWDDFLLYPANPWPHKNHARLFEALRGIAASGRVLPLVCTGRLAGEGRSAAALAAAAGLDGRQVRDLGYVEPPAMPALFRSARALVFPSLFEGFGIPVLEAMAAGCPVACSDLPPLRELAGEAARFFEPTSSPAMAGAILEVWDDAPLRERLRRAGRARAEQYRWPRLIPDLMRVYEAARAGGPGR